MKKEDMEFNKEKVEDDKEWIDINDRLPENNSYDINCMIRFNDGYETVSDCGTVYAANDGELTHWKYLEDDVKDNKSKPGDRVLAWLDFKTDECAIAGVLDRVSDSGMFIVHETSFTNIIPFDANKLRVPIKDWIMDDDIVIFWDDKDSNAKAAISKYMLSNSWDHFYRLENINDLKLSIPELRVKYGVDKDSV